MDRIFCSGLLQRVAKNLNKLEQDLSHIECGIKLVEVQYMHPPLESLLDLFPQLEHTICVIIGRKDCKSDAAIIAFFTSLSE